MAMRTMTATRANVHASVCKYVLRRRSWRLLSITALVVWVLTIASTRSEAPWIAFLLMTLLLASISWLLTVVPVLVLRRYNLTTRWATQPTFGAYVLAQLSKASTWHQIGVLALSGSASAFLHVFSVYSGDSWLHNDPKLAFFAPTKRYPYQLNERFVFMVLCLACAGTAYAAKDVLLQRSVIRWTPKSHKTLGRAIQARLQDAAVEVVVGAIIFPALFWILYLVLRIPNIRLLLSIPFARPFISLFLRNSSAVYGLSLYRHTVGLLFRVLMSWELAQSLFDAYSSNPVKIVTLANDPQDALAQGVKDTNPYFEFMAWHELARLTPDARRALFSHPQIWASIVRDALLRLGRDYQLLLRGGEPLVKPAPLPVKTNASMAPKTHVKPVEIVRSGVVKSNAPQSPLRFLADDGAMTNALTVVPDLFLSASPVRTAITKLGESIPGKETVVPSLAVKHLEPLISMPAVLRSVLAHIYTVWTSQRPGSAVHKAMPDAALDLVVVDALSRLVAASLTEDAIGTVQRDIPRVLEALCALLEVVEDAAIPHVIEGVRGGLSLICLTFGERMQAFRVPVRTARKLQAFLDYM